MKKCKITVLKRHFDKELAKEFGVIGLGECPIHKKGQTFFSDYAKPENFCDEAWKAIYQYVFALAHDSKYFYNDDWIKIPGVAICSCNDGIRPVIFKIEKANAEPAIFSKSTEPPQTKEIVMALAKRGWTVDEISKSLGISPGEVELIIELI